MAPSADEGARTPWALTPSAPRQGTPDHKPEVAESGAATDPGDQSDRASDEEEGAAPGGAGDAGEADGGQGAVHEGSFYRWSRGSAVKVPSPSGASVSSKHWERPSAR